MRHGLCLKFIVNLGAFPAQNSVERLHAVGAAHGSAHCQTDSAGTGRSSVEVLTEYGVLSTCRLGYLI